MVSRFRFAWRLTRGTSNAAESGYRANGIVVGTMSRPVASNNSEETCKPLREQTAGS
jgi:hypothetical protein